MDFWNFPFSCASLRPSSACCTCRENMAGCVFERTCDIVFDPQKNDTNGNQNILSGSKFRLVQTKNSKINVFDFLHFPSMRPLWKQIWPPTSELLIRSMVRWKLWTLPFPNASGLERIQLYCVRNERVKSEKKNGIRGSDFLKKKQ